MQTSGPFSRRRFVGAAGAAVAAIAAKFAAPGLIRIAAAQSWRGVIRSASALLPARRGQMALCCGRALRPSRCRPIRKLRAA